MTIIDYIMIAVIVIAAATFLFFRFRKSIREGRCSCCDRKDQCDKKDDPPPSDQ